MTNHQPLDPATDETSQAERIRRLEHRCDMEAHHIAELRTQINLLRAERDAAREKINRIMLGLEGCCMTCEPIGVRNQQMEREIATLKAERDEARLEVCQLLAQFPCAGASEGYAEERGWKYLNARDGGK